MAEEWFTEFEGAGLDGLVAKPLDGTYEPDKRPMSKIKHERTADCVVAGYRMHKSGDDAIGSLLLGLYDAEGAARSRVGVIGAFPMARRKELFEELQPLVTDFDDHPWAWAQQEEGMRTPRTPEDSRWAAGKDLSFMPLRPERVVEVRYDHMEGMRFRHTAQFVRWRADRDPRVVHLRPARRAGQLRPGRRPLRRLGLTQGRRVPPGGAGPAAHVSCVVRQLTDWTITCPLPTSTSVSVRTSTAPRSTRPEAGAALAVTVPGTVHVDPAGRRALVSVTETAPKDGWAKTSTSCTSSTRTERRTRRPARPTYPPSGWRP